jgi:hypothetical protein
MTDDGKETTEKAYYTITGNKEEKALIKTYTFATSNQEFIRGCNENEAPNTDSVTFECRKDMEEFIFTYEAYYRIAELRYGQVVQKDENDSSSHMKLCRAYYD